MGSLTEDSLGIIAIPNIPSRLNLRFIVIPQIMVEREAIWRSLIVWGEVVTRQSLSRGLWALNTLPGVIKAQRNRILKILGKLIIALTTKYAD